MLKIGIIGAGAISECHIESYLKNPEVKLCAICDVNENTAKSRLVKGRNLLKDKLQSIEWEVLKNDTL